jgi:AcrR family transcriptional regulator
MAVREPERRRRRSSAEIRRLMLAAARECFAQEGYAGATTKEIARRADVAEALLFRAFGSKQQLFEAAVVQPFDDFLAAYADRWMGRDMPLGTTEELLRQFVEELYELALEHADLFRAMSQADLARAGAPPAFARLEAMGESIKRATGAQFDPHLGVRIAAVTVIATAHFGDALFGRSTDRQRVVDELVRMLVGAALYVPPTG